MYHRNRLIKAFWRVWNTSSSGGCGVIGQVEANFVKPAHDKQDFERMIVLSRLETKLANLQKNNWNKNRLNDTLVKGKSQGDKARPDMSNSNYMGKEISPPVMEKCIYPTLNSFSEY